MRREVRARADDVAAGEFIENLLRLLALDAEPTLKLHWAGVLFGAHQFNLAAHEVKVVAGRVLRVRARAGVREAKRGQMLHGGGEFRRVAELILHPLHYGREVKRIECQTCTPRIVQSTQNTARFTQGNLGD